jgi:hypothetical protein
MNRRGRLKDKGSRNERQKKRKNLNFVKRKMGGR